MPAQRQSGNGKVRTSAGDNSNVNSDVFGKIAHSAAVQQGDENQRETFNAVRGSYGLKVDGSKGYAFKSGKAEVKKGIANEQSRKDQRAGGKGK